MNAPFFKCLNKAYDPFKENHESLLTQLLHWQLTMLVHAKNMDVFWQMNA